MLEYMASLTIVLSLRCSVSLVPYQHVNLRAYTFGPMSPSLDVILRVCHHLRLKAGLVVRPGSLNFKTTPHIKPQLCHPFTTEVDASLPLPPHEPDSTPCIKIVAPNYSLALLLTCFILLVSSLSSNPRSLTLPQGVSRAVGRMACGRPFTGGRRPGGTKTRVRKPSSVTCPTTGRTSAG
jgi:hypothetical protein